MSERDDFRTAISDLADSIINYRFSYPHYNAVWNIFERVLTERDILAALTEHANAGQVRWFKTQNGTSGMFLSIAHIVGVGPEKHGGSYIFTSEASEATYMDDRPPEEVIAAIDRAKAGQP